MCEYPALGIASPWQAPLEWAGFLLCTVIIASFTVGRRFLPEGLRRRTDLVPPRGRALLQVMARCGIVLEGLLLLVVAPAVLGPGLTGLTIGDVTPTSAACLETASEARSGQLTLVFVAMGALSIVYGVLMAIQQWRFPARPYSRPPEATTAPSSAQ